MSRKWTDDELKWLSKRHREMKDRDDGVSLTELIEELYQKFDVVRSRASIGNAVIRYADYDLSDDMAISNIKGKRSAQLSRSRVARENRVILDNTLSQEAFLDQFKTVCKDIRFKTHPKTNKTKSRKPCERVLVGHLSDTHIGVEIDPEELGGVNKYQHTEECRRHALFFKQLAEYKTSYRDETELVLVLNGDLMQGVIHDPEDAAVMTVQFARALSIYTQGISYLANKFKRIRVVSTPGNHARYMHKSNKGRVSNKKWDGFHTNLQVAIRIALKHHKNVEFEIPVAPYVLMDIMGHKVFIAHGDTVINVGNISKSINFSNIASQINNIQSALGTKIQIVMVGHVHKATHQVLDNGTEVLINGCLSGTDPFAQSIGILHNHPVQQMFEVTKDHAVGDVRFARLKDADDKEELDKIIEPLKGKFL